MKAIQVMFDEDFLRQRREQEIDAQYERAYTGVEDPLGKGFEGWENEGGASPLSPVGAPA